MARTQLAKKYIVRLTKDERLYLESLIHKGKVAAHKRLHAEILLKSDISELGEKGWIVKSMKPLAFQRAPLSEPVRRMSLD